MCFNKFESYWFDSLANFSAITVTKYYFGLQNYVYYYIPNVTNSCWQASNTSETTLRLSPLHRGLRPILRWTGAQGMSETRKERWLGRKTVWVTHTLTTHLPLFSRKRLWGVKRRTKKRSEQQLSCAEGEGVKPTAAPTFCRRVLHLLLC